MEIHEVRYFLAICDTLNFTRAAELCGVSQPSLTRAIKNLESKLGAGPLIARERANTHLTELGKLLQPYCLQILASLDEARSTARSYAATEYEMLRLGVMCTIGPTRMVSLFEGLSRRHPSIKLQLIDGDANTLQESLASGELDVAIFCKPTTLGDAFHMLPLYKERFGVAFPPGHVFSKRKQVSLKDLHGQPYLNRINCEYNDHIDEIMDQHSVKPVYPYESERDDWIQAMVMAGVGCTTIPEFAVSISELPWRPLADPPVTRTVNLVTVRGRPHGAAVGALVHLVKQHDWVGAVR